MRGKKAKRIPVGLSEQHVLTAMDQLGLDPWTWPARSASTKHDVIDPRTGMRLPPKLVLATAIKVLTGSEFSRKDISGGPDTNQKLSALGFKILPKSSDKPNSEASATRGI